MWSVVVIPKESTSTSISSTTVVEPALISTTFVPLIILFVLSIVSLIIVQRDCVILVDYVIVLSVFWVNMSVGRGMILHFIDSTPRCLTIFHVKLTIFHHVISVVLANVAKTLCLHKSNVLSADVLSTVIF